MYKSNPTKVFPPRIFFSLKFEQKILKSSLNLWYQLFLFILCILIANVQSCDLKVRIGVLHNCIFVKENRKFLFCTLTKKGQKRLLKPLVVEVLSIRFQINYSKYWREDDFLLIPPRTYKCMVQEE